MTQRRQDDNNMLSNTGNAPRQQQQRIQPSGTARQRQISTKANVRQSQQKPMVAPVTRKDVTKRVIIGCVITTIIILLGVTGIMLLNMAQRNSEQQATLDKANAIVQQAQAEVSLSPTQESVNKIVSTNANITVVKGATTTDINKPTKNNNTIGKNNTSNNSKPNSTETNESANTNGIGIDKDATSGNTNENNNTQNNTNRSTDDNAQDETVHGAGTVITSDGNIVTNMHVIENAKSIVAEVNGVTYKAVVTGTDPTSDIATIKIDAKNLPVVQFGDSSQVYQGQWVMTVGNPYGMSDSVSAGSVSALGRDIPYKGTTADILYANMIQTDAVVNPGNSGGGLYNSSGEYVGMVSIITTDNDNATGMAYAIPANLLIPIARSLIQGKEASHAVLGVSLGDVSQEFAQQNGMSSTDGALVTGVTASGPADNVKITTNDVITKYDGVAVKDAQDLMFKVRASSVNQSVQLTVLRNGKEMTFNVKLGSDV